MTEEETAPAAAPAAPARGGRSLKRQSSIVALPQLTLFSSAIRQAFGYVKRTIFGSKPAEELEEAPTPKPPPLTKLAKRREKLKRRAVEVKTDNGLDNQQLKYWQQEMKDSAEDEGAHPKMMLLMDIHKESKECTTLEIILERLVATDEQTRKEVLKLMEKMAGASVEPSLLATPTKSQTYSVVIKTPAEAPSKKPTTPESARPAAFT